MLIIDLKNCNEFISGDGCKLLECLHPDKQNIKLRYSLAHATLKPGDKSKPHKLKTSEVYYILEGQGIMHIDDESEKVKAEQTIYIPPNSKQWIENRGKSDLMFLCIVDPAWRKEDEVVL